MRPLLIAIILSFLSFSTAVYAGGDPVCQKPPDTPRTLEDLLEAWKEISESYAYCSKTAEDMAVAMGSLRKENQKLLQENGPLKAINLKLKEELLDVKEKIVNLDSKLKEFKNNLCSTEELFQCPLPTLQKVLESLR